VWRSETGKRALPIDHRRPVVSLDRYLIYCLSPLPYPDPSPADNPIILTILPSLLVELWREQHLDGVEQLALYFASQESPEQLHLV
jgi:hypothetical protein